MNMPDDESMGIGYAFIEDLKLPYAPGHINGKIHMPVPIAGGVM